MNRQLSIWMRWRKTCRNTNIFFNIHSIAKYLSIHYCIDSKYIIGIKLKNGLCIILFLLYNKPICIWQLWHYISWIHQAIHKMYTINQKERLASITSHHLFWNRFLAKSFINLWNWTSSLWTKYTRIFAKIAGNWKHTFMQNMQKGKQEQFIPWMIGEKSISFIWTKMHTHTHARTHLSPIYFLLMVSSDLVTIL